MRAEAYAAGGLAALALAAPAWAQPPVWTLNDADSEIVIFGSVHVLPEGLDWRPFALDKALAQADDLWFEVPLDGATDAATQRESNARGFLPEGRNLSSMLSKVARARLAKVAAGLEVPVGQLDRMQPWYAELTLSSALYRQSGAAASQGVEQTLASAAPRAQRRAFETPEQQVDFFANAPVGDQIVSLEETLKQIDIRPGDYQGLVRAWMAGDVDALDKEAVQPLRKSSPRLYALLVAQRNGRWAQRIAERLKGKGRTVVVVGVGHLVGKDGVPARLRAMGLKVDGPK
jgi:uncharacterized protein YbaP (TraB family)